MCDIFLPIMPAILCKYFTLGRKVQSCTYIAHWGNKYNLAHILRIGEEVQSCANLAHILRIGERSTILRKSYAYIAQWGNKYNLAQILCLYCALEK